jgi:hypothetical protein
MKKLIQISLVIVLVFVLSQAVTAGSLISSGTIGSSTVSHISAANTSVEGIQAAACLVRVKGVICVRPNVGWNS